MINEELLEQTLWKSKVKKYRSLPSWYKFYKLLLMSLNFTIWIWGIFLMASFIRDNRYVPIFAFYWLFFLPLIFYLTNWFIYILWRIFWFIKKIESLHEEYGLPKFEEAQKDLLSVIVYLLPLYVLFVILIFVYLFWYSRVIFWTFFILWILTEIVWIYIKLKKSKFIS
jgi:hypothetical protein